MTNLGECKMARQYPLKPKPTDVQRTFEVFHPKFSPDDMSAIAKDPSGYFRGLLESWGIPINGLYLDDKILNGGGPILADSTTIWHCKAPPASVSDTMIITRPS